MHAPLISASTALKPTTAMVKPNGFASDRGGRVTEVPGSLLPSAVQAGVQLPGQPLEPGPRAIMEDRFGHDFSAVRVHKDDAAAQSAREVGARAYAFGQHIAFGANEYAPTTQRGIELLAHELAHTVQQRNAGGPAPSNASEESAEETAIAAASDVASGHEVQNELPACGVGLSRSPVPPEEFSDEDLAKEVGDLSKRLKQESYPERDWDVNRYQRLKWVIDRRAQARVPAPTPPAKTAAGPAPQRTPARDEAAERAAAVKEAEEAARPGPEAKEEEEPAPTVSMALGKQAAKKKPALPAKIPSTISDPRWAEGIAAERRVNEEVKANSDRIEAQIQHDREISRKPYAARLRKVRLILQKKSSHFYSYNEAVSRMSGEEVWREGLSQDLFIESEKTAVYADQKDLQKLIEEERQEKTKRLRAKFETDQYRAHVARGEALSSPEMFVRPFAFAAMGPLVFAAYSGAETGGLVGQAYNACVKGTKEDCVAAAAPLVAAAVIHRATRSTFGERKGGKVAAADENVAGRLAPVDPTAKLSAPKPDLEVPASKERQVAGFGRPIELKTEPGAEPSIGFTRTPNRGGTGPEPTIGFGRKPKPAGSSVAAEGAAKYGDFVSTDMPPARVVPSGSGVAHAEQGGAPRVTGTRRDQPTEAMAGKQRVGTEHTSGARGSTESKHEVGQTRTQRQNAAADLRNEAAREKALLGRLEQLKARIERLVKNLSPGKRKYLETEGIDVQKRYDTLMSELSAADLMEIDKLRTQLRRELNIKGTELDDAVVDHLDRLGLMPTPIE